jgi:hypothetical protein
MSGVAREDSVRRGRKAMDEAASGPWLKAHLKASYEPRLQEPWIWDVDTTGKPLYGHQPDAKVGYNPSQPGRPSHAYHRYFVANLRRVLDREVQAGNQTAPLFAQPELGAFLDGLAERNRPLFWRGDSHWGAEKAMVGAEERGLGYRFQLKQRANGKKLIRQIFRQENPPREMGGGRATMAGERGRVAVERMEQGAAGGGAAAAVEGQTGSGSGNCGPGEVQTKSGETVDFGSTGTD